jgi:hypothetical protein
MSDVMKDSIHFGPKVTFGPPPVTVEPFVVYGCWPAEPIYPSQPVGYPSTVIVVDDTEHKNRVRYQMMLEIVVEMCRKKIDHDIILRTIEATLKLGERR